MKFGYTILYVEDVRRAMAFYQEAFGLLPRFLHESGDYGELETGATALAFSSRSLMRSMNKNPRPAEAQAPSFEIALTTEDVPAAMARAITAGAVPIQEPHEMPWGQTIAYVADKDGFLIEICTPMRAE